MFNRPAIAEAPANARMRMVLTSCRVPNRSPRCAWARYARARPFALPPGWKASAGMRAIVAKLLATRNTLIIKAAASNSRRVFLTRPAGCSGVSSVAPRTRGMTVTPVSKPDRPSAGRGNSSTEIASMRYRIAMFSDQRLLPINDHRRMLHHLTEAHAHDDGVEQQVRDNEGNSDSDCLCKSPQKDQSQQN